MLSKKIICLLIFVIIAGGCFSAFAEEHKITDKAELIGINMYLKNIRKKSSEQLVVFEVKLKNVSATEQRYKMMVYIPEKGAGEDYVPYKSDERAAPGEEVVGKVAVFYGAIPSSFELTVEALE